MLIFLFGQTSDGQKCDWFGKTTLQKAVKNYKEKGILP
jgi:hypothetical protein